MADGNLGTQLTLTSLGGIISGQIYSSKSAPHYTLGHAWSLGSLALAFIIFNILHVLYKRREIAKGKLRAQAFVTPAGELADKFKYQF